MTARFRSRSTGNMTSRWFVAGMAIVLVGSLGAPLRASAQTAPPSAPARGSGAAAPSAAAPTAAAATPAVPADYVIGADDALSIVFWREKDMSADVSVRSDGKISLPL